MRALTAISSGLLAVACGGEWAPRAAVGAAWSDDGERVLVSVETWEERPQREPFGTPSALEYRDGMTELWDVAPDGSDARLVFGPSSGVTRSAFFMRRAGYLLVPHQPAAHTPLEDRAEYGPSRTLRVPLDGSAPADVEYGMLVPSPSGAFVARVQLFQIRGERERRIEVQLLDGVTLTPAGGPIRTGLVGDIAQLIWLDDERMAVQVTAVEETLETVHIDGTVAPSSEVLDCAYPSTSSSPWDAGGRLVTAARAVDGGFEIAVTDSWRSGLAGAMLSDPLVAR